VTLRLLDAFVLNVPYITIGVGLFNGVSVVSGGASGLGRATAEHLARGGSSVAILDRRPQGKDVADRIGGAFFEVDVTNADAVARAVDEASASAPLRLAVCCAGVMSRAARVVNRKGQTYPSEDFDSSVDVNLRGTFNTIRACAAAMARAEPIDGDGQRGLIVTTASIAGLDGASGDVAYSAAKAGIVAMSTVASRDLSVHGIRVVSIAPGDFDTPLARVVSERVPRDAVFVGVDQSFPQRRGRPEEFAALVDFIARCSYINGACIRLDAGVRMR
jgi:NAD(P)-dependent dehydrogenase (short-subunit alcohol dehydrogenase family)